MIDRMDTRSMMQCLLHCGTLLKQVSPAAACMTCGRDRQQRVQDCDSRLVSLRSHAAGRIGALLPGGYAVEGRQDGGLQKGVPTPITRVHAAAWLFCYSPPFGARLPSSSGLNKLRSAASAPADLKPTVSHPP